jgi:hypothetical protein
MEEIKTMMEENNKMLWDILQDLKEIKEIWKNQSIKN